jgi:hypothetical protein
MDGQRAESDLPWQLVGSVAVWLTKLGARFLGRAQRVESDRPPGNLVGGPIISGVAGHVVGTCRDEVFFRPAVSWESLFRHVASGREGFRWQDARRHVAKNAGRTDQRIVAQRTACRQLGVEGIAMNHEGHKEQEALADFFVLFCDLTMTAEAKTS